MPLTPKGRVSITAALLGAFSLLLPWVSFTVTNGATAASSGESPAMLLRDLVAPFQASTVTDPGLLAWQQMATVGYGWWILGSVIFAMGCVLLIGQAFSSIRWAGLWLLLGTVMSGAGIASFSARFPYQGYVAFVGFSGGFIMPVLATILGLIPVFRVDSEDRWVAEWKTKAYPGQYDVTALTAPVPAAPVAAASTIPGERRFCPSCGRWYLAGEQECERDHTPLKPVPEGQLGP